MVKNKNIALWIILSLCTCGIGSLIWFVNLTDDSNTISGQSGTSGGMALLLTLVTCGIYGWFWAYKLGEKLDIASQNNGQPAQSRGMLFVILNIFGLGIVTYALAQNEINNYAA